MVYESIDIINSLVNFKIAKYKIFKEVAAFVLFYFVTNVESTLQPCNGHTNCRP